MKLKLAIPVLGALALVAALPDSAQARSRSSVDVSVGFGYSNYNSYRYNNYNSFDVRYSRGYGGGYRDYGYVPRPRYYSPRYYGGPRVVYRDHYYYRPAPRVYVYDECRPVYRPRYYYRDSYYCD